MPLFWFVSFTNGIKRIRDRTFCSDIHLGPNPRTWHTSRIHRAGCIFERLRQILYVQIPTFVVWETINDKFAIPLPILPIASKRRVTHYPRVSKKKNKGALTSSNNQKRCSYKLKQTKKGCSYKLKRIHICGVHLGLGLKLLRVVLVFYLHLFLFWWGSCLELTLVYISISTSPTMPACSIPIEYVREICIVCLHVQLQKDMCTTSDLYRICACIFNSQRICAQLLTCIGSMPAYSIPVGYVHKICILTCIGIRACIFNSRRICAPLLLVQDLSLHAQFP